MRHAFGFGFPRGGKDGIAFGLAQDRLAPPTGLDFPNCRDALGAHPLSPQRGRMTIDVVGSRNFQILLAGLLRPRSNGSATLPVAAFPGPLPNEPIGRVRLQTSSPPG